MKLYLSEPIFRETGHLVLVLRCQSIQSPSNGIQDDHQLAARQNSSLRRWKRIKNMEPHLAAKNANSKTLPKRLSVKTKTKACKRKKQKKTSLMMVANDRHCRRGTPVDARGRYCSSFLAEREVRTVALGRPLMRHTF